MFAWSRILLPWVGKKEKLTVPMIARIGVAERLANVWCYSGLAYAESPDSFLWEEKVQMLETVERVWLEPDERHFRVRAAEGLSQLCYHELADEWSIVKCDI